ncbi:MAG: SAP domain-containing protein [Dehalococcoidia bacterium]|nr:SAP domain-containing protein [Dehalococcoidia bacterium]
MNINNFVRQPEEGQEPVPDKWDEIIVPESSYLLTGDVGKGKSALAYYLIERYSQKYNLTPSVVGVPRSKRDLLPEGYQILDGPDEIPSVENAMVFIDEADIQLPLDSNKDKQRIVNALSLPRQRNQIFILAYHFPRLVKGTYLPFFGAFLFKRPPYLVEFASKRSSGELMQMMTRANERFDELVDDVRKHTYVVAPKIRWQGMLENTLPGFWTADLSRVWSGTGGVVERQGNRLVVSDRLSFPALFKRQDEDERSNTKVRLSKAQSLFAPGPVPYDRIIEYDKHFSKDELKQQCRDAGLSVSGDKKMLAARIIAHEDRMTGKGTTAGSEEG